MPRKRLFIAIAILFFCAYAYGHRTGGNWNANARLDVLHSVVLHGEFSIDRYHANTGDKAFFEGHYYSSKAPGMTVLALPAFVVSMLVLWFIGVSPDTSWGWALSDWITTAGSVGVLAALGAVAFFAIVQKFLTQRDALLATLGIFLGSLPFPYATMLFSHAGTIGLLTIALYVALRENSDKTWYCIAGLCISFAIAGEFVAAIAAVAVAVFAVWRAPKLWVWVFFGAIVPLLLVPLYSWVCFSTPFTLGYSHEALYPDMLKTGFLGISFPPQIARLHLLLLSPGKGLLPWTPFFCLAIPGFIELYKTRRDVFWLCACVVFLHILLVTGHRSALGGDSISARNYAAVVPFLGIASAFGLRSFRRIGIVLIGASVTLMSIAAVFEPLPPDFPYIQPLFALYIPLIMKGITQPNIGSIVLRLPGLLSLLPLVFVLVMLFRFAWKEAGKNLGGAENQ